MPACINSVWMKRLSDKIKINDKIGYEGNIIKFLRLDIHKNKLINFLI